MKPKFYDILRDKLRSAGIGKWCEGASVAEAAKRPDFIKAVEAAWEAYNVQRPSRDGKERGRSI